MKFKLISSNELDHAVILLMTFMLGLGVTALWSARLGMFSGWLSILIGLCAAGWVHWYELKIDSEKNTEFLSKISLNSIIIIGIALIGGVFSGIFATNDMWGGRDFGVYMELTQNIVTQGTTNVDRDDLRAGFSQYNSLLGHYPGIYDHTHPGHSEADWVLISQFNDLSPAYRAVFVEAFGFAGFQVAIGFFAFLTLLLVGVLTNRMGGVIEAYIAMAMVMISASFIYVSRTNLSEVPTIFVTFSLFFVMYIWDECKLSLARSLLMLGYIGLAFFMRADGYIIALAFVAYFFFLQLEEKLEQRALLSFSWIVLGSALIAIWSHLDLKAHSGPYQYDLFLHGLKTLVQFVGAVSAVGIALIYFTPSLKRLLNLEPKYYFEIMRNALYLVIGIAFSFFAYKLGASFFADLDLAAGAQGAQRLELYQDRLGLEFTWYITIPVIILACVGAFLIARQKNNPASHAFIVFFMFCFVLFSYRNQVFPDHPWAVRRWAVYVYIPLIMLASISIVWICKKFGKIGWSVSTLALVYFVQSQLWTANGWMFNAIQKEWKSEFDEIAAFLEGRPEKHFLVSPVSAAAVLAFQYDLPALPSRSVPVSGLRSILKKGNICTTGLQPWVGVYHYDFQGMKGQTYDRCFDIEIKVLQDRHLIPEIGFDFKLGGVAREHFIEGWHNGEKWGIWSSSTSSTILLDPDLPKAKFNNVHTVFEDASKANSELVLEFDLRAFLGGDLKYQKMAVFFNSVPIGELEFTPGETHQSFVSSLPVDSYNPAGQNELRLSLEQISSPKDVGLSNDVRNLGIGLERLSVFEKSKYEEFYVE